MTLVERELFKGHFNCGGYVLNFTTAEFDSFTARVVGIPLCRNYGLSKGKSLGRYLDEASDVEAAKLCKALLDYEESCFPSETLSAEGKEQIRKMRSIVDNNLDVNHVLDPIEASIKKRGPEYIRALSVRAKEDFKNDSFDSTLTKARTILEESFCYAIEVRGETPPEKGNITDLEGKFKSLYQMRQSKENDNRINDLITGIGKIVSSIGALRNIGSDAHGLGTKRFKVNPHHAKLCLNAATILAEFILDVVEHNANRTAPHPIT